MVESYRPRTPEGGLAQALLLLVAVVGATAVWTASASASNQPLVVPFEKQWVAPGQYVGTACDGGTIELRVVGGSMSGPIQHLTAEVTITLGQRWFTARLDGVFNGSAGPQDAFGRTVLNGTVTGGANGWLVGARVHEEGALVDPNTGRFVGELRVTPASTD